jgi:hypothetical protein
VQFVGQFLFFRDGSLYNGLQLFDYVWHFLSFLLLFLKYDGTSGGEVTVKALLTVFLRFGVVATGAVYSAEATEGGFVRVQNGAVASLMTRGDKIPLEGFFGIEIESKDGIPLGEHQNLILLMHPALLGRRIHALASLQEGEPET